MSSPNGLARDENGDVYIRQQNGRILKFDALGNFVKSVEESPIPFQTGPLAVNQPAHGERTWIKNGSGNWCDPANWYYWGRPDTDYEIANLGSAVNSDAVITVDQPYMMKGVRFRSENSYAIRGSGEITLQSNTGQAILASLQGVHNLAIPIKLLNHTTVSTKDRASLGFTGGLNLNGRDILITGDGQIKIDCSFIMNGGSLILNGLSPVTFAQTVSDTLDGNLVFEPHKSFKLTLFSTFKLFEGSQYLAGTFTQIRLPDLAKGLIWDKSLLYEYGKITIVPDRTISDFSSFVLYQICLPMQWLRWN